MSKSIVKSLSSVKTIFKRFEGYSIEHITAIAHSTPQNAKALMNKPQNFKNATIKGYIRNANSLIDLLVQPNVSDIQNVQSIFNITLTNNSLSNFTAFEKWSKNKPGIDHILFKIATSDSDVVVNLIETCLALNSKTQYQFARIIIGYTEFILNKTNGRIECIESAISTRRVSVVNLQLAAMHLLHDLDDLVHQAMNYTETAFGQFIYVEIYWD